MSTLLIFAFLGYAFTDALLWRKGDRRKLLRLWILPSIAAVLSVAWGLAAVTSPQWLGWLKLRPLLTSPEQWVSWLNLMPHLPSTAAPVGLISGVLFAVWMRHRVLRVYELPFGSDAERALVPNVASQPASFVRLEAWWLVAIFLPPVVVLAWPEVKHVAGFKTALLEVQFHQVRRNSRVPFELKRNKKELGSFFSPSVFALPERELEMFEVLKEESKDSDRKAFERLIAGNMAFKRLFANDMDEVQACLKLLGPLGFNHESLRPKIWELAEPLFSLAVHVTSDKPDRDAVVLFGNTAKAGIGSILASMRKTLGTKRCGEAKNTEKSTDGDYLLLRDAPIFMRLVARVHQLQDSPADGAHFLQGVLKKPGGEHARSGLSWRLLADLMSSSSLEARRGLEPYERAIGQMAKDLDALERVIDRGASAKTADLGSLKRTAKAWRHAVCGAKNNYAYELIMLGEQIPYAQRLAGQAYDCMRELAESGETSAANSLPAIIDTYAYAKLVGAVQKQPADFGEIRAAKLLFDEALHRVKNREAASTTLEWRVLRNWFDEIQIHADQAAELLATEAQ